MRNVVMMGLAMLGLCAATVAAQPLPKPLPVHMPEAQRVALGYPKEYTDWSQAVWVTAQEHWAKNPNVVQTNNTMMQHVHADILWFPYAEINSPMWFPVRVVEHNTAGHLIGIYGDTAWSCCSGAMLDAPVKMDVPPPYNGNPDGNVTFTGQVYVDPTAPRSTGEPSIQKGWFATMFSATALLDNGDDVSTAINVPYYSTVDPDAPEPTGLRQGYPNLRGTASPHTPRTGTSWGTAIVQFGFEAPNEFIPYPRSPMTQTWTGLLRTAGYGAGTTLPPATVQLRLDPDFHHGAEGTVLTETTGVIDVNLPIALDPTVIAAGTPPSGYDANLHALRFMWCQPDFPDTGFFDKACAILGFDANTGDIIAPPPPPPPPPTTVAVPSVVRMTLAIATGTIQAAGLTVGTVTFVTSPAAPPAQVVTGQSPAAGTQVQPGTAVNLTVLKQ